MDLRVLRNIPTIVAAPPHKPVVRVFHELMFSKIAHMVFQQDEARLPANEIKTTHNLNFMPFDIDREKVDRLRGTSFRED